VRNAWDILRNAWDILRNVGEKLFEKSFPPTPPFQKLLEKVSAKDRCKRFRKIKIF